MAKKQKYDYLLDNKKVGRQTFFNNLKNQSLKKVRTYDVGGFGVSVYDFDKTKYNSYRRVLHGSNGYAPRTLIFSGQNGKSQKFSIVKK